MLLALYLLRVEPDAPSGDHSWDHEELDPVPERYAIAVADDDGADHEGNGRTSPQKLPSSVRPATRLLRWKHPSLSSLQEEVCRVEAPRASPFAYPSHRISIQHHNM